MPSLLYALSFMLITMEVSCKETEEAQVVTLEQPQQPIVAKKIELPSSGTTAPTTPSVTIAEVDTKRAIQDAEAANIAFKAKYLMKSCKNFIVATHDFEKTLKNVHKELKKRLTKYSNDPTASSEPLRIETTCKDMASQAQSLRDELYKKVQELGASSPEQGNIEQLNKYLTMCQVSFSMLKSNFATTLQNRFAYSLQKQLPTYKDPDGAFSKTTTDIVDLLYKRVEEDLAQLARTKTKDSGQVAVMLEGTEMPYEQARTIILAKRLSLSASANNTEIADSLEKYAAPTTTNVAKTVAPYISSYLHSLREGQPGPIALTSCIVLSIGYGIASCATGNPLWLWPLIKAGAPTIGTGILMSQGREISEWIKNLMNGGIFGTLGWGIQKAQQAAEIPTQWDGVVNTVRGIPIKQLKVQPSAEIFISNPTIESIIETCTRAIEQVMVQQLRYGLENMNKAWLMEGKPGAGKTAAVQHIANSLAKRFPGGILYIDVSGNPKALERDFLKDIIFNAKNSQKAAVFINLGESITHAKANQGDNTGALNLLLNGFENLYKESLPIFVFATTNKPNLFPDDLAREGRMTVIRIDTPTWEERYRYFEAFYKKCDMEPTSASEFNNFATLTDGANRAQLGVIGHIIIKSNEQGMPPDSSAIQEIIHDTLHPLAQADQGKAQMYEQYRMMYGSALSLNLNPTLAAHFAGQFLIGFYKTNPLAIRQGLVTGFASALSFTTTKKDGDNILSEVSNGQFLLKRAPMLQVTEPPLITKIKSLLAGAEAQMLLINPDNRDTALIEKDRKAAMEACEELASSLIDRLAQPEKFKAEAQRRYLAFGAEVSETLRKQSKELYAIHRSIRNTPGLTYKDYLEALEHSQKKITTSNTNKPKQPLATPTLAPVRKEPQLAPKTTPQQAAHLAAAAAQKKPVQTAAGA